MFVGRETILPYLDHIDSVLTKSKPWNTQEKKVNEYISKEINLSEKVKGSKYKAEQYRSYIAFFVKNQKIPQQNQATHQENLNGYGTFREIPEK